VLILTSVVLVLYCLEQHTDHDSSAVAHTAFLCCFVFFADVVNVLMRDYCLN